MDICSNGFRRFGRVALPVALLAMSQWPQPAAAFHVMGVVVTKNWVDSSTRTVSANAVESTVGTGSVHSQAIFKWGDAVTSNKPWTSTTGTGPKFYTVAGVTHTYPDLTDRTITVLSDCCNASFLTVTDTVPVQLGCSDTPLGLCHVAGKAKVLIKNDTTDDTKDKLKFLWLKGDLTVLPEFGDPTLASPSLGGTEYYLCIYAPGLVLQAVVPPGSAWSSAGGGFQYADPSGAAGGVTQIKLKEGGAGKSKVKVKGRGMNLDDPLPLTQPVTVQLQNSLNGCWGHGFTSPEIKNTPTLFKDKE